MNHQSDLSSSSRTASRTGRKLLVVLTILAAAGGFVGWTIFRDSTPSDPIEPPPKPADDVAVRTTVSRYLNTKSPAKYVGSNACISCHRDPHQSWSGSAHANALSLLDPAKEPPDGVYHHEKSGRRYQVQRRDGRMWHGEFAGDKLSGEIDLGELPVKYVIGSGHFSRSYLVEADGFLMESPITWYASKKQWLLSPGYDIANHMGFTRPADVGCLTCHSGRVESVDRSVHRLRIHEAAVSCENCHGPGSLHVNARSSGLPLNDEADWTIVNPAKLSRERREDVCSQCHLQGAATVLIRGRKIDDFRPGLPLSDFRIDYRLETPTKSMKVVGHLEQMRNSRCYTQSKTMTCTTCHNPHVTPEPKEQINHYRKICQSCHAGNDDGCKLEAMPRLAKNPANNCVACHMSQVPTDLPHFAFTHHRIGLNHSKKYDDSRADGQILVPMSDVSHLSPLERERCLGLAYLELSWSAKPEAATGYRQKGYVLLQRVYAAGVKDSRVLAALAGMHSERGSPECVPLAEAALAQSDCLPSTRVNSLLVIGNWKREHGQFEEAKMAFEQLVTLRRHSEDWVLLGLCRLQLRDGDGAITAWKKALTIRPDRPGIHAFLVRAYEGMGKPKLAAEHRRLATALKRLQPTP